MGSLAQAAFFLRGKLFTLQSSLQQAMAEKASTFEESRKAEEGWQQERSRLLFKQEELSQWAEKAGGRITELEGERSRLLDRMKALLKENKEGREETDRLRRELATARTRLDRATEEAARLKVEMTRLTEEAPFHGTSLDKNLEEVARPKEAGAPPKQEAVRPKKKEEAVTDERVQKLQVAFQKEAQEVRKDTEYTLQKKWTAQASQLKAQIKGRDDEIHRLSTQLEAVKTQLAKAEHQFQGEAQKSAQWEADLKRVLKEAEQTKAESQKKLNDSQEKIKEAQRQAAQSQKEVRTSAIQRLEKSRLDLEKLRSNLTQDWAKLYLRVGVLEARQGNFKEAEAAFKYAVRLEPTLAAAHYNLGVLYDDHLKNPSLAIQEYEQYLLLSPRARDAKTVQGWVQILKAEETSQSQRQAWNRPGPSGFIKTLKQIIY